MKISEYAQKQEGERNSKDYELQYYVCPVHRGSACDTNTLMG